MENIFYDKIYGEYTIGFQITGDETGIHETQRIYFKNPKFQSMNGTKIESTTKLGPFIRIDTPDNSSDKIKAFINGYYDAFLFENETCPIYIFRDDKKNEIREETIQQILNIKPDKKKSNNPRPMRPVLRV